MAEFTTVAVVAIICASILFGLYMVCCQESEVGMFQNPKYEKRIRELEKHMEELRKE